LQSISVNLSANVAFSMIYHFVRKLIVKLFVGKQLVSKYGGLRSDVLTHNVTDGGSLAVLDHTRTNLSAAFQDSDDHCFIGRTKLLSTLVNVDIPRLRANESLIHFDLLSVAAKLAAKVGLHGKTNAMQHEPCTLLSDAD